MPLEAEAEAEGGGSILTLVNTSIINIPLHTIQRAVRTVRSAPPRPAREG